MRVPLRYGAYCPVVTELPGEAPVLFLDPSVAMLTMTVPSVLTAVALE